MSERTFRASNEHATNRGQRTNSRQEDRLRGFAMLTLILTSILMPAPMTHASVPEETPCDTWRTRIKVAAVARDYAITPTQDGFSGHTPRGKRLMVSCKGGHASARIVDRNGTSIELELTGSTRRQRQSYELSGDFPGVGSITHTHVFRAARAGLRGFSSYSAVAGDEMATVETSFETGRYSSSGEVERVNDRFRTVLQVGGVWGDAHAFAMAAGGLLDEPPSPSGSWNPVIDVMSTIAVPPPPPVEGSKTPTIVSCLTSGAICGATIFLPILAAGCVTATAGCVAQAGCYAAGCG